MKRPDNRKGSRSGVELTCPCGKTFYRLPCRVTRSRCCSKACQYKFMRRPSGLKYNIEKENKGWFTAESGHAHRFKKGHVPITFKGNDVGYDALHDWVRRHAGKPTQCQHCGTKLKVQWANKSWEYKRDLSDWLQLCYRCHRKYDREGGWGLATDKFPRMRRGVPRTRRRQRDMKCESV